MTGNINTLESISTEDDARNYLSKLRWGKWASCPHCDNKKAYVIEGGKRYKCANRLCYKKFSVTTKTLLEATNISLLVWVGCVRLYAERKGVVNVYDIEKIYSVAYRAASHIKNKLDFSWSYVLKERQAIADSIEDIFECLFNLYDKMNSFRSSYVMDDIDDISDITQYRKIRKYTIGWLRRATWLYKCCFEPEDIIAETFIYIKDNHIKEYNAELVSFLIRKCSNIMLRHWYKEHPNEFRRRQEYHLSWQRNARRVISDYYVRSKLRRTYKNKTASEIRIDIELIKQRKMKIIAFREKYNILYDFNSHFD